MTDSHQTASVRHVVSHADTAAALGSGDLEVLGTPRLLAWCEEATCAAVELSEHETSVGTRVEVRHVAASAVGRAVTARAELVQRDERTLHFTVTAVDEEDTVVASGTIVRAVVDRERFLRGVRAVGD